MVLLTDRFKKTAEKIFQVHSEYVYRVTLFFTKSKVLTDDITQET